MVHTAPHPPGASSFSFSSRGAGLSLQAPHCCCVLLRTGPRGCKGPGAHSLEGDSGSLYPRLLSRPVVLTVLLLHRPLLGHRDLPCLTAYTQGKFHRLTGSLCVQGLSSAGALLPGQRRWERLDCKVLQRSPRQALCCSPGDTASPV